jgi:hypothetical protein
VEFFQQCIDRHSLPVKNGAKISVDNLTQLPVLGACEDSSYISGQFLHPNGDEVING